VPRSVISRACYMHDIAGDARDRAVESCDHSNYVQGSSRCARTGSRPRDVAWRASLNADLNTGARANTPAAHEQISGGHRGAFDCLGASTVRLVTGSTVARPTSFLVWRSCLSAGPAVSASRAGQLSCGCARCARAVPIGASWSLAFAARRSATPGLSMWAMRRSATSTVTFAPVDGVESRSRSSFGAATWSRRSAPERCHHPISRLR
jgi:hypothetical protein